MSARSVADLAEFPFATFKEFREAHREGRARVWIRYDFPSVWAFSHPIERAGQIALTGSAFFASLIFALLAVFTRDLWWLCGIPAAFLGLLTSSPSPGPLNGGCIAISLVVAGVLGSVFLDRSLLWAGIAGFVCYFFASAGQGIADATIREAMLQSEATFLRLYSRAITKVEAVEEKQEAG